MKEKTMYLRWLMVLRLAIFMWAGNYQAMAQYTDGSKSDLNTFEGPPRATLPYLEGFESGNIQGQAIVNWVQNIDQNYTEWWTANNTNTDPVLSPRTGSWNAYLNIGNLRWMFQSFSLKKDTHYTFKMYARSADPTGNYSSVKVSYGNEADASEMVSEIVVSTPIEDGEYQLLTGGFTPSQTKNYAIGIFGQFVNVYAKYISIDDISLVETPATPVFTISHDSKNFGDVYMEGAPSTQTFTIHNFGLGTLGITGVALSGTDKSDFTFSTEIPKNLSYGESTSVDVNFKPTAVGVKTASLDITDDHGKVVHTVALTGEGLPQPIYGPTCESPIPLTFPAVNITGTTGDYGNYYNSSYIAESYYYDSDFLNGYEVVYEFTLDADYALEGTISTSKRSIGAFILNKCPNSNDPPTPLISNCSYGKILKFPMSGGLQRANNILEAGPYFLIISSNPDPGTGENQSVDYTIDLSLSPVNSTFSNTGNWSDPNNWTNNLLPGSNTNVTINGNVTVDGYYECNSLTIAPAGAVTIPEGENEYLEVKGELLIQSDATGTGSFIDFGWYSIWGESTIERYLTKYNNSGDQMFHFISSPVAEQAIRPEFVSDASPIPGGTDFYSFSEATNEWINTRGVDNIWNIAFEEDFTVGKGYMVAYPGIDIKEFSGTLNSYTSDSPLVLECTNTSGKGNGWNLLGNPFPSAIDWDYVVTNGLGDGMDDALYYYDNTAQNYRSYIKLSGESGSLGSGQRWIPAMQGFMVHAKDNLGLKMVTISNAARTHLGQNVFYKSTSAIPGSLSLKVSANGYEDEAFIHFNQDATSAFDGSYDAYKLRSYSDKVPMIFTKGSDNSELAINGLPELDASTVIPIYFETATEGAHILTANVDGLPNAIVNLVDIKLNKTQNLKENPVYSFTASNGENASRFKLTFSSVGINNPEATQGAQVYAHDGVLYVETSTKEAALVNVYNLTGQLVKQGKTGGNTLSTFNASGLTNGVYVVNVILNQSVVSRKVVIRK